MAKIFPSTVVPIMYWEEEGLGKLQTKYIHTGRDAGPVIHLQHPMHAITSTLLIHTDLEC